MAGAEERRVYARALFRAGAKMRACALQDRELRAGAMLRLAGFSAGRSVCARGGCSAGQSESIAAFCVRIMTGARFYRNVLRSVHAYRTFLSECLAFGSRPSRVSIEMSCVRFTPIARFYRNVLRSVHACCLPQSAKQDGLRGVAFLFRRGSGSPVARSRIAGAVIRISWFTSGLRVFCGDPDGSTRGRGGRRRRGVGAFLRDHIGFVAFSAGSTLGLRAPNLRQRVFDSLDSLHAAAGLP